MKYLLAFDLLRSIFKLQTVIQEKFAIFDFVVITKFVKSVWSYRRKNSQAYMYNKTKTKDNQQFKKFNQRSFFTFISGLTGPNLVYIDLLQPKIDEKLDNGLFVKRTGLLKWIPV